MGVKVPPWRIDNLAPCNPNPKPWKWGATARYYTSHTMLPTRKSLPRSAGNWTTWRSYDDRKETQTAVVWSCLPFIRSGQNHLARHSERERRQGRQRKRSEDIIKEWTGLEFAKSQRPVENRGKLRKLVAKSSVVPQRPSRLRHWWWLMMMMKVQVPYPRPELQVNKELNIWYL